MSDTSSLVSGFKVTLVAEVVRVVGQGVIIVTLARLFLSPHEYGLLFLAISVFSIALLFSRLGIANSTARYLTDYRETEPTQVPHIVRTSLLYGVPLMLLVATVISVFRRPLARLLGESELAPLLLVGFLYIVTKTLNAYLKAVFQGFNRINWSAKVTILSNAGILVFVLLFLGLDFGVIGALFGYVTGYALGVGLGLVYLQKELRTYDVAPTIESGLRRRILEYSIPLTVTKGANVIYNRVDIVLIGFFINPTAVGYYTLAKQISGFVAAPANSLGFAVSPTYGEHKANDRLERAARIYETTFKHTVLFYVPAAAGLVIVADPVVRFVFGTEYLGAVAIIQVFALFTVFHALEYITSDALDFLGRARHRAISKAATGGLNFVLNLALIPMLGAVGAALSTVLSYGLMVLVNLYLIHAELELSVAALSRTLAIVCGITAGMVVAVLTVRPVVSDLVTLAAAIGFGGIVWLGLAATSGLLNVQRVLAHLR